VGDDTEAPKAPRLRRRVLYGVHNRSWGTRRASGNSITANDIAIRSSVSHTILGNLGLHRPTWLNGRGV